MTKKKENFFHETTKKLRGSWNGVNPVTKIIPDKKKYSRKKKHKNQEDKI